MSAGYRKYIQTLTIDDLKIIYPLSNKVNDLFGKSLSNNRKSEEKEMIYHLILSGQPIEFFENAKNPIGFDVPWHEYLNEYITKNGFLFVCKDKYSSSCTLCGLKECTTMYYYYYPKIYDCYYPSCDIYYDRHEEDKDKQFEDRILCTVYMKRIFDFAEECIVIMYNNLFNKYKLFKYIDISLDIDVSNYLFLLSI